MLYKPSNPSPYNSVLDIDDKLSFSAFCIRTDDIGGMRLAIKDNVRDYYLPIKSEKLGSCLSNSSMTIPFNTDTLDGENGYAVTASYNSIKRTRSGGVDISNLIKPFAQYRWQVRLYQKDTSEPEMNIAYGSVQEVIKTYDENGNLQLRRILKVRPHTNMFMKHLNDKGSHDTTYDTGFDTAFTEYYDDNVKYYIQFKGAKYKVEDYYYRKVNAYYDSGKKQRTLEVEKIYDSEPLFSYIEIDLEETIEVDEEGNEKKKYC